MPRRRRNTFILIVQIAVEHRLKDTTPPTHGTRPQSSVALVSYYSVPNAYRKGSRRYSFRLATGTNSIQHRLAIGTYREAKPKVALVIALS